MKRLIPVVFALFAQACGRGYSDGQRRGTIVKFSEKGVVCKTHEGIMTLGGVTSDANGAMVANTWEFTVLDPALAARVVEAMDSGKPATLVYTQWWWSPPCSMGTDYEVVGVK